MTSEVSSSRFLWLGEQRALDFLNTEPMVRGQRVDLLASFEDLVTWCTEAELLSRASAKDVHERWGTSRAATRTLDMARKLRSEARAALESRTSGRRTLGAGLEVLNGCLQLGASTKVIVGSDGRFERQAQVTIAKPDQLLRPIAEATAELLCDVDLGLVRRCDNPECVLYFRDVSKNHARRWCSMSLCGNRRKVAVHQQRKRAENARHGARG